MLTKELLELIYQSAHIKRWNDHICPHKGFTELDKQAHKMVIAYVLAKCEEDRGNKIKWRELIEGGMFEFFHRVVLTDIKPPIYHLLMTERGEELNSWVIGELETKLNSIEDDFLARFRLYLDDDSYCPQEKQILRAAHYLATNWEFGIIYHMNASIYGVEQTKERIENEIEDHFDLLGVQKIGLKRKTYKFVDLVGQLRFQQRWAQSPRVPETSVLGHMLIVAMCAYVCSVQLGSCDKRIYNNYFAGLFHDLPEVLTRDIVSPIKRSVKGLEKLIKEIESLQMKERIFPLLPASWHNELKYFTENEFDTKIMVNGNIEVVTTEAISEQYNKATFNPLDGKVLRACDHLAAYLEACFSIDHGITSKHLIEGKQALLDKYSNLIISGLDFGELFAAFSSEADQ